MSLASPSSPSSPFPIHWSPAAIAEIKRLQSQQPAGLSKRVRLNLTSGGCEEFLYDLKFEPNIHPNPNDQLYCYADLEFVIPADALLKIQGLHLDYSEDLMGGGFRFHNPNATKSCGCGNSFSIHTDNSSTSS